MDTEQILQLYNQNLNSRFINLTTAYPINTQIRIPQNVGLVIQRARFPHWKNKKGYLVSCIYDRGSYGREYALIFWNNKHNYYTATTDRHLIDNAADRQETIRVRADDKAIIENCAKVFYTAGITEINGVKR